MKLKGYLDHDMYLNREPLTFIAGVSAIVSSIFVRAVQFVIMIWTISGTIADPRL